MLVSVESLRIQHISTNHHGLPRIIHLQAWQSCMRVRAEHRLHVISCRHPALPVGQLYVLQHGLTCDTSDEGEKPCTCCLSNKHPVLPHAKHSVDLEVLFDFAAHVTAPGFPSVSHS
eukprot:jgi/Ulvmu1/2930/UM149_0009.1